MNNKQKGNKLENFVHHVYSTLLELENNNVIVSKNVSIAGRSGASHEFDVYYEFFKVNLVHRVAIECKNHSRPISKKEVIDFRGKISEIDNFVGAMVSKNGYQRGAKQYGKHYGITLMTLKDLPSFNELFGLQIKSTFLPSDSVVGEPFWSIMESSDDGITGNYYSERKAVNNRKELIPLFFSKKHATIFCNNRCTENFVVRGINQRQLKGLLKMTEGQPVDFLCFSNPIASTENLNWKGIELNHDDLKNNYLIIDY